MQQISTYILLFFIYSFLGWSLEVICKFISDHKFVNRGFLIGPYCPIYGWGTLIMTLSLNKYLDDPVTLFIMIVLICSILEYLTSYFLEKIYHTRWWDYSNYKFNINGRICLETMIPFGILGMLIMYRANPFFISIINQLPSTFAFVLSILLIIIFIVDNIISSKTILEIQKINKNIQNKLILKKDDTERITKLVREKIEKSKKVLNRRLIHAFPHLELLKRTRKKNTKRKN